MGWTKEQAQQERENANQAVLDGFVKQQDVLQLQLDAHAATPHGGAGGDHPDAATHEALGLAPTVHSHAHNHDGSYSASGHTHTHNHDANYSATGHNHDAAYSASGHGHTHDHDADYEALGHDHAGVYEPTHAHPYSSDAHNHDASYSGTGHTHQGGDHPDLAAHDTLGLATQTELNDGLATKAASGHNHDASYSASGHNHDATYINEGDHTKAAHDALNIDADTLDGIDSTGFSLSNHTHPGGSEAFPVGSVFIGVVSTNPGTLLGYGTWSAFGAGRVLVGVDAGDTDFDTVEETGGAKTHTLTEAEMPAHSHVENSNNATTGPLRGWGAADTSTNTSTATGYSTAATGGGGAHNNMPPYITCYFWKRTA